MNKSNIPQDRQQRQHLSGFLRGYLVLHAGIQVLCAVTGSARPCPVPCNKPPHLCLLSCLSQHYFSDKQSSAYTTSQRVLLRMFSPKAGLSVFMQGRLDCIQTLLANPYLMRLVRSRIYIYTHTQSALFVQYNTIALNAEVMGALYTLKMKAIKSESCIRKKQVSCFLVISFVAWVPVQKLLFASCQEPVRVCCILFQSRAIMAIYPSPQKCSICCFTQRPRLAPGTLLPAW